MSEQVLEITQPKWSSEEINNAPAQVEKWLNAAPGTAEQLESADQRCSSASWFTKVLHQGPRAACAEANNIRSASKQLTADAVRVLTRVMREWEPYARKIHPADRAEYAKEMAKGAADFYYFLVTDVFRRRARNWGMEQEQYREWGKHTPDFRYLWNVREEESTFRGAR
jgi:hypothetical protein